MIKRTSRKQVEQEMEAYRRLYEFRRTPRLLCVVVSHDDIPCPVRLRVSYNEEPPQEDALCSTPDMIERMKEKFRDLSLGDFEQAFCQFELINSPWGPMRRVQLNDLTPDYFDSYSPEAKGAPDLERID
ncbi:MAG TPA: hypothetical protein VGG10_22665 [Rhizomicrobium sp.]|jgi:hypothetical protein